MSEGPYHYGADPLAAGGGQIKVLPNGAEFTVFTESRGNNPPGLAVVHVSVEDTLPLIGPAADPIQRVVMTVKWQGGRAGGSAEIDITRGAIFTVGGADVVSATARIVTAGPVPIKIGNAKRVEATVTWAGSMAPRPAFGTSEAVILVAAVVSPPIPIPVGASKVITLTDTPAGAPGLTLRFISSAIAAPRVIYEVLNPTLVATPIVSGAEFIRYIALVGQNVTPVWELWI